MRTNRSQILFALAAALMSLVLDELARAGATPEIGSAPNEFTLRVLTYNVQGLPIGVKHDRYADIGRILADRRARGTAPHIVAIQEAFAKKTRDIAKYSGYPFVAKGPPAWGLRMNAGLMILSEFPIVTGAHEVYDDCAGVDCLARKGVQHARVEIPGVIAPIDLFNTHLNASYSNMPPSRKKGDRVRVRQVREAAGFVARNRTAGAVLLFAGDFNFRKNEGAAYSTFLNLVPSENSARACHLLLPCTGEPEAAARWAETIDHWFYDASLSPWTRFTPTHFERTFEEPYKGRRLSDHSGVEVHYAISW